MKLKPFLALALSAALLLTGCAQDAASTESTPSAAAAGNEDYFSGRDLSGEYDKSKCAYIQLNGSTASCGSNAVSISDSTVTIQDEGTYILSGSLDNGMIIVNADKEDKIQLVLNDVSIRSETSAAIYVLQADKVFLTLPDGTASSLSSGETYTAIDENNIDAAIYSREDLTINGTGCLTVTSPGGHGIVSKDELTITGGDLTVNSASHGLDGKDCIAITGAKLAITSGKDGIHAENDDDETLGWLYIESGAFTISAEGDGISAAAYMTILDGTFDITTGGGSVNSASQSSDSWGGFMGGGPGGKGGHGPAAPSTSSGDDSTSIKGLKASGDMTISGGSFTIDSADDAVHSNSNITISGGTFTLSSGDDGFHADTNLHIADGIIRVTESYEGLEGECIDISGGDISLVSSDDGINAAGGTDSSGFGGYRGNDKFGGGSSSSSAYIHISGGTIFMNASGDGIDANGSLTISGGTVTVYGPTNGDTSVLDYDNTAVITGGTFIGTGASMMAQTFSDSEQGVLSLSVGNQAAGTSITLTDSAGSTLISVEPNLPFAIVILSTPDMVKGERYTITVGSASGTFEAD